MMQMMIYMTILTFSMIFMQMNHPLAMGLMLLAQTLLIAISTGMMMKSFWFSYILFLVFLGGMLVLFIYVTSLASNEMFSMSMKLMLTSNIFMFMMIWMMLLMDKMMSSPMLNLEMNENFSPMLMMKENSNLLNKMYNFPTNLITMMLIIYLLITLMAIVKITNIFYGPIRQMN